MEPLGPLGRALACSAFAALTVPLVLLSSRSWIAISALIVAVVGAIYQIDVRAHPPTAQLPCTCCAYDAPPPQVMAVRSDFWTHILVGTALLRCSWCTMAEPRGNVKISYFYALLGGGLTTAIAVLLVVRTDMARVYNQMHELINVGQIILFISFGIEDFLTRSRTCHSCMSRSARARLMANVRHARAVIDPATLFAIGMATVAHQHDRQPIGVFFHESTGYALYVLAAAHVTSGLIHTAAPDSAMAKRMRSLYAVAWAVPGVLMLHMSCFVYVERNARGLHHIIYGKAGSEEATAIEIGHLYLSIDIIVSAALVATMYGWLPRAESRKVDQSYVIDHELENHLEMEEGWSSVARE